MLHRTNDSYRATNPADEFLGPEPEDEDELPPEDEDEIPEPTVEEVWGVNGYFFEVTFASGRKYTIHQAQAGAHVGDYDVVSPDEGVIANGYLDPQEAIAWLCDPERRDW